MGVHNAILFMKLNVYRGKLLHLMYMVVLVCPNTTMIHFLVQWQEEPGV